MTAATRGLVIPGILIAVLVGQVGVRWWIGRPDLLIGPVVGEPFPPINAVALDDSVERPVPDYETGLGRCAMLVFVDPSCGICQRLRVTWPPALRAWRDSLGVGIDVYWLSVAPESRLNTFYDGFELGDIRRERIVTESGFDLRDIGVYGTPLAYLLDARGRFRVGMAGGQLPPVDTTHAICK